MPPSKKRQAECPRGHKLDDDVPYCMICGKSFTCVQPITLDNETFDRFIEKCTNTGKPNEALRKLVQPIPNCPDGRYRPRSKAPGQTRGRL